MANQSYLKRINRQRILLAVRESGPLSRSAIADLLALDRKSMTNLANELIAEGWLCETGVDYSSRGRPGTLLDLDRTQHLFLGLHLSENQASGVLLNLSGEILGRQERPYAPVAFLKDIRAVLQEVYLPLLRLAGGKLHAIGLVLPGILDFASATVQRSVNIPVLDGVELRRLLPRELPSELYFEESSRAKALAELWFGQGQGRSSFVCVDLGIGIGAGIILEKHLQGGPYAGEIGHVIIQPEGRQCACGHRGCLEAYISESILCRELSQALQQPIATLDEVGALNPAAEAVLAQAGRALGLGLATIVNILCPPLVILHGSLLRFAQQIFPAMEDSLATAALPSCRSRVEVRVSSFGAEAAALGAAAVPLGRVFLG
ncbi:MAG: ROK family transcriptional regulator [Lentisphaerae bacterium]|nr:ROK family transcriptional regulator [Lentisphaerota bacterium]